MKKEIETQLDEIIALAKRCPENLQEKCFEKLFDLYFVKGANGTKDKSADTDVSTTPDDSPVETIEQVEGDEIKINQIHSKVKALFKKDELTLADINNLFYREGKEFKPLYDDLKSAKMADSQIRLTLLGALQNALDTGDFKIAVEEARRLCDTHKCYDKANFAANYKNYKALFTDEYKKGVTELSLSPDGKKELVRIAAEIAR